MASRWEQFLEFEKKPVPLIDHLLDEVAKLLAKVPGAYVLGEYEWKTHLAERDELSPPNPGPLPPFPRPWPRRRPGNWEDEMRLD